MEQNPPAPAPKARQQLHSRLFWFFAGAGVNYLLISIPFKWLRTHTTLQVWAISACSIGISALFFFCWNYFVNFRTDSRKRDAGVRYIIAVGVMWLLSSSTLAILKQFNFGFALSIAGHQLDLDIVATQFFLGGLKFLLYHKWAFPVTNEPPAPPAAAHSKVEN
jgi:putative flippase GtrA